MSDTILGGDITVYYEAENRQKRLEWTGAATGTQTANAVYSALQDLFDNLGQMDDGVPMSAQTPTEYTIGIIDTGDDDPWFIDDTTVEHITGGAIQTSSWTRTEGSNTGIIKVKVTATTIVPGDIGQNISHTDTDIGTLLDVQDLGGSEAYLWIRPDTDAVGNSFSSTGTLTEAGTSHVGTLTYDATPPDVTWETGESLWANIFTIGTISSNSHIYVEQNNSLLTAAEDTTDWWIDGHIDTTIKVKDADTEIDEGVITVFARQLTKTYSHFETDLTNGGRTAIPLGTGGDLNAADGALTFDTDAETGAGWSAADIGTLITDDGESNKQGVITAISGTGPNYTIEYYLIGDPLTDFVNNDVVENPATDKSMTLSTGSSAVNGAAVSGVTYAYANSTTLDIDEDDTAEEYSIVIDANSNTLADVYAYTQYLLKRGNSVTTSHDGQQGQFYRGIDYVIQYTNTPSGAITEGNVIEQEFTGAKGTIVAHDTTNDVITLRDSRGTFLEGLSDSETGYTITDETTTQTLEIDTDDTVTAVSPNAASPFGTFAGGIWFLARGVTLDPSTVPSADAQNFRSLTNDGTVVTPPNKVTLSVSNLRVSDRVTVHRLDAAAGVVKKDTYTATVQSIGAPTVIISGSIGTDEPGKTTGLGSLVIVDDDLKVEYPIRYASWSGSTFTLANTTGTATTNASDILLEDTGAPDFTAGTICRVGDIVSTASKGYSFITSITDADNCVMAGGTLSGFTSGDAYELNAIPVATTADDRIYVPLLYRFESTGTDGSAGSESNTLTYGSDIPALVRVRNAQNTASATTPMLPYAAEVTVTSTGLSNAAIRTLDSIHS